MLTAEDSLWLLVHSVSTRTKGKGFFRLLCTRQQHHSTNSTLVHGHRILHWSMDTESGEHSQQREKCTFHAKLRSTHSFQNCYRTEHGSRAVLYLSRLICKIKMSFPAFTYEQSLPLITVPRPSLLSVILSTTCDCHVLPGTPPPPLCGAPS